MNLLELLKSLFGSSSVMEPEIQRSETEDTSASSIQYVDLGLPSGLLWAEHNVETVVSSEEYSLPSYEQAQEFIECCDFYFVTLPNGERVIVAEGPNGRFITFPLKTYKEHHPFLAAVCWCEGGPEGYGYCLILSEAVITIGISSKGLEYPFRLVREK